jgi:hypothetical protein
MLPKMGLLRPETIRTVMDAYVLTEQYLEGLILAGGRLRDDMPIGRQLVYVEAHRREFVIAINRIRAGPVAKAIDALAPYLK